MTTSRIRLLALAAGLLAAGSASAATLSVYAKMTGPNAVGVVVTAAGSDASAAINCATNSPTGCVDSDVTGTVILQPGTLTNATFVNWSGCGSVAGNQCTVDLTTSKTVTANFRAVNETLTAKTYPVPTATFTPAYGGTVDAPLAGIAGCSTGVGGAAVGTCAGPAAYNSTVVVTATPNAASTVTGWSGCTTSSGNTCNVTMSAAKTVSVTFGALYVPVKVAVSGPGSIVGAALPDPVNCTGTGGDCTGGANANSSITLTIAASTGAKVAATTGCATFNATTGACTVTVGTDPVNVTATMKAAAGCTACHQDPPSTHGATASVANNCAFCHGSAYSSTTVDPTTHANGTLTMAAGVAAPPADPPAGFGFNLKVIGFAPPDATLGAAFPKGYVDFEATDANGAKLDVVALIQGCETYSRSIVTSCTGANVTTTPSTSNRTPRISIGQVLADGTFKPVLRGSTDTTVQQSETMNLARLTPVSTGSKTYRYVPQYGWQSAMAYSAANTYRAVVYGGRYFKPAGVEAVGYYSSDFLDVVGTNNVAANDSVTDPKCNACHGKLTLHGMRRGVNICLTCHNPNTPLGTGNTDAFKWDLKNLVHKLHSGLNYDGTNPMTGNTPTGGGAWGSALDASHMAMGPSHTLYFEGAGSATAVTTDDNVHQLETQIQCSLCHDTAKTDHLVASQAGCSSCHPINWVTGAGHGSSYPTVLAGETGHPHTDAECAGCHPQTGPFVEDFASVPPVISVPVQTVHSGLREPKTGIDFARTFSFLGVDRPAVPFNNGVQRHVLDITVDAFSVSGTRATIDFTALLDGQAYTTLVEARAASYTASSDVYGGAFPTCAFTLAGPANRDYVLPTAGSNNLSCGAFDATDGSAVVAIDAANGKYRVTPAAAASSNGGAISGYPDGTYTLSFEMMYSRQGGDATTGEVRKPFAAAPKYYTVTKTGTTWTFAAGTPRRAVVTWDKCNACHIQVGFHSNQGRQGPDYCAMCHNPMLDNSGRDRVKFAAAKPASYYGSRVSGVSDPNKVYLVESVSMNMFIHRIHMGSELPSVAVPADAGPWVPEPGRIFYGATRSAFVGVTATTPPDITDMSFFGMPNPMGRCDQCHIDNTWASPPSAERAPVVRRFKLCASTVPSWAADTNNDGTPDEAWCNNASNSGPSTVGTLYTPPVKAVCTSCHDSLVTDAHADMFTQYPMTSAAVESCADCPGEGALYDSLKVHAPIP